MILLYKAIIVTSYREDTGALIIDGERIRDVIWRDEDGTCLVEGQRIPFETLPEHFHDCEVTDLDGKYLMAGGIDAHVHFRDPGLTHKADMKTESEAAIAGGVTTVFDMPNTIPATVDAERLRMKLEIAADKSKANIGFHIGASNSNVHEICRLIENGDDDAGVSASDIQGVKVFMGSSTGNMLVDDKEALVGLFRIRSKPVLVHCEEESIIKTNLSAATEKYGEDIPFSEHQSIRSRKACIVSSIKALELAMKYGTRLVLCHISTKEELNMVAAAKAVNPAITAETSCNYLWFSDEDYDRLGSRIKCNPSIKTSDDRQALREGLKNGTIDTIGSDHAPHLLSEKEVPYSRCPSGIPSIQQSLPVLLTIAKEESIPLTRIASVFSENASALYGLDRGKIAAGMKADLVVFDYNREFTVMAEDQYSKCGWTPYEGERLNGYIETVFINGKPVFERGNMKI